MDAADLSGFLKISDFETVLGSHLTSAAENAGPARGYGEIR